jgi:hypothetical protein
MNNKPRNNDRDALSIDYAMQPWTRKWSGWLGFHPYKNQVGGAFNKTKHEYQLQLEQRNRKNKLLKQKNQKKH